MEHSENIALHCITLFPFFFLDEQHTEHRSSTTPKPPLFKSATLLRMSQLKQRLKQKAGDLMHIDHPTSRPSSNPNSRDTKSTEKSQLIDSHVRSTKHTLPVIDLVSPERISPASSHIDQSVCNLGIGVVPGEQQRIFSKNTSINDDEPNKSSPKHTKLNLPNSSINNDSITDYIDTSNFFKFPSTFASSDLSNNHINLSFIDRTRSNEQDVSNESIIECISNYDQDMANGHYSKKDTYKNRKKKKKRSRSQYRDKQLLDHNKHLKSPCSSNYNVCEKSPETGDRDEEKVETTTSKKLVLPTVPTEKSANLLKHNLLKNLKAYERISGESSTTSFLKPKQISNSREPSSDVEKFIFGKLQCLEKDRHAAKKPLKDKDVSPDAVKRFLVAKQVKTAKDKTSTKIDREAGCDVRNLHRPLITKAKKSVLSPYANSRSLRILEAVSRANHKNETHTISKSTELKRLLRKVKSPNSKVLSPISLDRMKLSSTDDSISSPSKEDGRKGSDNNTLMHNRKAQRHSVCPKSVIPKKGETQKYYAKRSSTKRIGVVGVADGKDSLTPKKARFS